MSLASLLTSTNIRQVKVDRTPAVYFLIYKYKIVYIGQAKNILNIFPRHAKRRFDRVIYRPVRFTKDLDRYEQACIIYFRPKGNKAVYTRKVSLERATFIVQEFLGWS